MTIVHWCKYDHNNLMEKNPKRHVVHLLLPWIMILFPCSIFHDFNSPVDCFKFNFKCLSNKAQLNSKTQVNIFVYMVDVSYGNWTCNGIIEDESHQTTSNMQSCQLQLYILESMIKKNFKHWTFLLHATFLLCFLLYLFMFMLLGVHCLLNFVVLLKSVLDVEGISTSKA